MSEVQPVPFDDWRKALRRERRRARLTIQALAALIHRADATLGDWERGVHPPVISSVNAVREVLPDVPPLIGAVDRDWMTTRPSAPIIRPPEHLAGRPAWAIDLYQRRIEHGLTLQALSWATGLDVTTLCLYETGRHRPGLTNQARLDEALA